jgi:hypothetical protein
VAEVPNEEFVVGLEVPDRAASVATAQRPPRSEAHRNAQRLSALNQWKAKDRRDGVPPPLPPTPKTGIKKTSIEVLLSKRLAEDPAIQGALNEYVRQTAGELGGMQNLRAGQRAMLLAQRVALLVILAVEDQIVTKGTLLGEDGKPEPLLAVLEKYLATFRQGQIALGLGLRSRMFREDSTTLDKVLKEYEKRNRPTLVKK